MKSFLVSHTATALHLILGLVLLIATNDVSAQNVNYIHYNIEDGLPSSEVYDAVQDEDGYMWFATDRGIVRFDGIRYEVFDIKDGLACITNFKLFIDLEGQIWVNGINGTLSFYNGHSFTPFIHNDKIAEVLDHNGRWFEIIEEDDQAFQLMNSHSKRIYSIDKEVGDIKEIPFVKNGNQLSTPIDIGSTSVFFIENKKSFGQETKVNRLQYKAKLLSKYGTVVIRL